MNIRCDTGHPEQPPHALLTRAQPRSSDCSRASLRIGGSPTSRRWPWASRTSPGRGARGTSCKDALLQHIKIRSRRFDRPAHAPMLVRSVSYLNFRAPRDRAPPYPRDQSTSISLGVTVVCAAIPPPPQVRSPPHNKDRTPAQTAASPATDKATAIVRRRRWSAVSSCHALVGQKPRPTDL